MATAVATYRGWHIYAEITGTTSSSISCSAYVRADSGYSCAWGARTMTVTCNGVTQTAGINAMNNKGNTNSNTVYFTFTGLASNTTYSINFSYDVRATLSGVYQGTWSGSMNATTAAAYYAFNLNILNPSGAEAGANAGSVEQSVNGGGYARISNEQASSYVQGTTLNYRNFTPAAGQHLYSVSGLNTTSTAGPWSTTMTGAKTVAFQTAWDTYSITYNANGGSSTPAAQTKTYNVALALRGAISRAASTANGYTVTFNGNTGSVSPTSKTATNTTTYAFAGWKSSSDSVTYSAGASYQKNAASAMTAQWTSTVTKGSIATPSATKANTTAVRTVTFNANGGSCSTDSLNSNATVVYSALGWYTATSGGTKRCDNGGTYTPSATETLYQQWSPQTGSYSAITLPTATKENTTTTRTVTFNANGGSCSINNLSSSATTVYTQSGWYTATSGGTKKGTQGASYTPSATETLYAQYTASQGNFSQITLPLPQRQNYIFLGWAENPSASSGVTGNYTPSKSLTLYAIWALDQATVWIKRSDDTWYGGRVWYKKNRFDWKIAKFIYKKRDEIIKDLNLNDSSIDIDDTRAGHTILASNKIQINVENNSWARVSCEIFNLRPDTEYWIETDITNESGFNCGLFVDNNNHSTGTQTQMHKQIKIQSDSDGYIYFEFYGNLSDTAVTGNVIFDNLKIKAKNVWIEYKPISD